MARNKYNGKLPRSTGGQKNKGKLSQKSLAIISVCAIILGVFITAQEYLDRHTQASAAAQTVAEEALANAAAAVPDYVKTLKTGSSDTETLTEAAEILESGSFLEKSDAYKQIASVLDASDSDTAAAKALTEAMSAAEDAAVAYNQEAQALNEKIVKFPYNIVAQLGGYAEYPIFALT